MFDLHRCAADTAADSKKELIDAATQHAVTVHGQKDSSELRELIGKCPLMLAMILVAVPKYTKGKLTLVAKNKAGQPLKSKVEALDDPRDDAPDLLAPAGTMDRSSVATAQGKGAFREIKEWQAIMDHLRALPVKGPGELPMIPVDERAAEVGAFKAG